MSYKCIVCLFVCLHNVPQKCSNIVNLFTHLAIYISDSDLDYLKTSPKKSKYLLVVFAVCSTAKLKLRGDRAFADLSPKAYFILSMSKFVPTHTY